MVKLMVVKHYHGSKSQNCMERYIQSIVTQIIPLFCFILPFFPTHSHSLFVDSLSHFLFYPFCICLHSSVQFSRSVMSDSLRPMNHSMPGLPVHHQLPESTQNHVHWVGDAIQPSHPLLPPSPPALTLSQHQGLFKWVSSSHQVAKVLEFQFQHQPFQWTPRTDLL